MGIRFSKWVALSIVLHSTLTSALVVPRAAYSGYGQPYGTGNTHPNTTAASSSTASQASTLGTSCVTPGTITVTLSGSSIVPLASITGTYPIASGPTTYGENEANPCRRATSNKTAGWPSAHSPSSIVSSSIVDYPVNPSVPPPENPATLDYPAVTPTSNVASSTGGGYGPSPAPVHPHPSKLASSTYPESTVTPSTYSMSSHVISARVLYYTPGKDSWYADD